jgi:hypothetical protein
VWADVRGFAPEDYDDDKIIEFRNTLRIPLAGYYNGGDKNFKQQTTE